MTTKELLLQEFEEHGGEFVIACCLKNEVKRLVGIAEDEYDYLYVLWDGWNITYMVCNSYLIHLKGFIQNEDYNYFERMASMNHSDRCFTGDVERIKESIMGRMGAIGVNLLTTLNFGL